MFPFKLARISLCGLEEIDTESFKEVVTTEFALDITSVNDTRKALHLMVEMQSPASRML